MCYNIGEMEVYAMFIKKTKTPKGTYLQYVESYVSEGKNKQKVIEKIGYLEDFLLQYDDPVAHFSALAVEKSKEKKTRKYTRLLLIVANK